MAAYNPAPWWLPIMLAGLSLAASIYMQATHTDKENASRISALEAHQGDSAQRLDRIENKIDRLIDWAGRKH